MPRCFEFEVSLRYIKPRIWRRFLLSESATFADLHAAIQDAFGWERCHMWEFMTAGRQRQSIAGIPSDGGWGAPTPDASRVMLSAYFRGKKSCRYVYDFGDDWEHDIKLVRTTDSDVWRALLAGARACPPEDCGGVPGYELCVEVATGVQDDDDFARWLGDWQPDAWSLAAAKRNFDRELVKKTAKKKVPAARSDAVIADLFTDPPEDQDELERLLGALHRSSARRALAEALEDGGVPRGMDSLATEAFSILGLGRQQGRLEKIARSGAHPMWRRGLCLRLLAEHAPEAAAEILGSMSRADQQELVLSDLSQLAQAAYSAPQGAEMLTAGLRQLPSDEERGGFISGLAVVRRMLGIPASGLYREVWQAPDLALLRTALINEGTRTARMLLAGDDAALALMDAGLREVLPGYDDIPAPPSQAWMSTCDGQGAFNVFVSVGDQERLVAGVCIRAAAEIRDAWVLNGQTPEDVEDIMADFTAHASTRFIEAPLGAVAAEVEAGLERGQRADVELDEERWRAAALILHQGAPDPLEAPPARALTLSTSRSLLEREEYGAWFFDEGDLRSVGLPLPPKRKNTQAKWKRRASRALNTPAIRTRLIGMTAHMARWHRAAGEAGPAGLCQAAHDQLQGGRSTPLLTAMIGKTVEVHHAPRTPEDVIRQLTAMLGALE